MAWQAGLKTERPHVINLTIMECSAVFRIIGRQERFACRRAGGRLRVDARDHLAYGMYGSQYAPQCPPTLAGNRCLSVTPRCATSEKREARKKVAEPSRTLNPALPALFVYRPR